MQWRVPVAPTGSPSTEIISRLGQQQPGCVRKCVLGHRGDPSVRVRAFDWSISRLGWSDLFVMKREVSAEWPRAFGSGYYGQTGYVHVRQDQVVGGDCNLRLQTRPGRGHNTPCATRVLFKFAAVHLFLELGDLPIRFLSGSHARLHICFELLHSPAAHDVVD
jgi:hypothetical protein